MTPEKQAAKDSAVQELQIMHRENEANVRLNKRKLEVLAREQTILKRKRKVMLDAIHFIKHEEGE